MAKTAAIVVKMEPELKIRLAAIAAYGDGNLSALVREMIRENLKDRQCRRTRNASGRDRVLLGGKGETR